MTKSELKAFINANITENHLRLNTGKNTNIILNEIVDAVFNLSGGWTMQTQAEIYNDKIIKKITGYVGGTGTLPTELSDSIGKYIGDGIFTTDKNLALDFRGTYVDQEFDENSENAISNKAVSKLVRNIKTEAREEQIIPLSPTSQTTTNGFYRQVYPLIEGKNYRLKVWQSTTQNTAVMQYAAGGELYVSARITVEPTDYVIIDYTPIRSGNLIFFAKTDKPDCKVEEIIPSATLEKYYVEWNPYFDTLIEEITVFDNENYFFQRVINNTNGDSSNITFYSRANIPLPKNLISVKYKGNIYNSSNITFCPLLGIKHNGEVDVLINANTQTNPYSIEIELNDIDWSKYVSLSVCTRKLTNTTFYLKFVISKDDSKSVGFEKLENNDSDLKILDSYSTRETGWYSSFVQSTNVTYHQYTFGWFIEGSSASCIVFKLNNITGEIEYKNLSTLGLDITNTRIDGHNAYAITITKDGYIIIGGDCHVTTPKILRSKRPFDISEWENFRFTGATDVTYIRFFKSVDNKLYSVFRRGRSGNGNTYFCSYNDETNTFSTPILLIDATTESAGNPYLQTCIVDRNGVIKIAFGFRQNASDWNSMNGMYYIESADNGITWRKSDGTTNYVLPIKKSTAERIYNIDTGNGYVNQNGSCVDKNNNFNTVTFLRLTENGNISDWVVRIYIEDYVWKMQKIFDTKTASNSGGLYTGGYGRPTIFCNQNNDLIVLLRENRTFNLLAINCTTLEKKIVTVSSMAEPTFDMELARDKYILSMLFNINPINNLPSTINRAGLNRFTQLGLLRSKLIF